MQQLFIAKSLVLFRKGRKVLDLIAKGAFEHLSFQLAAEDLASLILRQSVDKHYAGCQLLVGSNALLDPVHDGLLQDLSILPDHISSREFARPIIRNANDGNIINSRAASDQVFQFRRSHLKQTNTWLDFVYIF